jgi:ATP adenylyltransferase
VVTSDLGPEHYLVLNKFAVVPEHFILATRAFKPQTHVLEEDDLAATRACIDGYGGALFAFFNCGEHSGASQPHRHIQLLPVEAMREGLPEDSSWDVLANRLLTDKAPFVTFAEAITADMSSGQLHEAYVRLYQKACRAVALYKKDGLVDDAPATGETKISYNMAMTSTALVVCPRLSEGSPIPTETSTGSVALNGTVLAGTALVKSEAEWEALKGNPDLLHGALEAIGIPV